MKKPRVLVLCKRNSRRSQLVDAVLRGQAATGLPWSARALSRNPVTGSLSGLHFRFRFRPF